VLPGRLSVSRAVGDAHAKLKKFGGNPNVITCDPEIKSFKVSPNHDFIIIGSDGLFDKLTNAELVKEAWTTGIQEG
jgi:protein phosphatase 2C family protein 2/3